MKLQFDTDIASDVKIAVAVLTAIGAIGAIGSNASASSASASSGPATGSGRPVPNWAPHGARWVELPGAPTLEGPDGTPIPVRRTDSGPERA